MAFIMSWRESGDGDGAVDAAGRLARFRHELYLSLGMRRDVLFEVCDAAPPEVLMAGTTAHLSGQDKQRERSLTC